MTLLEDGSFHLNAKLFAMDFYQLAFLFHVCSVRRNGVEGEYSLSHYIKNMQREA